MAPSPLLVFAAAAAAASGGLLRGAVANRVTSADAATAAEAASAMAADLGGHAEDLRMTYKNAADPSAVAQGRGGLSSFQEVEHECAESNENATGLGFPDEFPWNELDRSDPKVLGKGSFGVARRYYTKCHKGQAVVVKNVKLDQLAEDWEREDDCKQVMNEVNIHIQMAASDKAVRIYDLYPKDCKKGTLIEHTSLNILMARAWSDGTEKNARGTPSYALMLDISKQLLDGVQAIHRKGYLHRDIKPANLLFESEKRLKYWTDCNVGQCRWTLSDFGMGCKRASSRSKTTCTNYGGSPPFMAPELGAGIISGDRASRVFDKSVDYWALGVTLYDMAFGGKLPGKLGSGFSTRDGLWYYLKALADRGQYDWWHGSTKAKDLKWDARTDKNAEIFLGILNLLLQPHPGRRTSGWSNDMAGFYNQIRDNKVSIPAVCLDPCERCRQQGQICRAGYLKWECVLPPTTTVNAWVNVLDAHPKFKTSFALDAESADATELRDLKMLMKREWGTKLDSLEKAAWNFAGKSEDIFDWAKLTNNGEVDFSPWLRQALLNRQDLKDAIDDAERTEEAFRTYPFYTGIAWSTETAMRLRLDGENKRGRVSRISGYGENKHGRFKVVGEENPKNSWHIAVTNPHGTFKVLLKRGFKGGEELLTGTVRSKTSDTEHKFKLRRQILFPYLPAAKKILDALPSEDWRDVLKNWGMREQAELAETLRPHLEEAQTHIAVQMVKWFKFLDKLESPMQKRLEKEHQLNLADTKAICGRKFNSNYCAQNVNMDFTKATDVDYLKVEYKLENKFPTKLKFYKDGDTFLTRTEDKSAKTERKVQPALPGGVPLKITFCKDAKKSDGPIDSIVNKFVKSTSRCSNIGKPVTYTLYGNGVTYTEQQSTYDRKRMLFPIVDEAENPAEVPDVSFKIWDGDFVLS